MALITIDRSYVSDSEDLTCGENHDLSLNLEGHFFGENYLAVRGAAVILSNGDGFKTNLPNHLSGSINGEIRDHLQLMIQLIRPQDYIKLAVRLEQRLNNHSAYMTIVSTGQPTTPPSHILPLKFGQNKNETFESLIIGIDICAGKSTIGLVLPLRSDSRVELDGDGGFNIFTDGKFHNFKPISVQTMWSSLQYLIKEKELVYQRELPAENEAYCYYESHLKSDLVFILAWLENPDNIQDDDQLIKDSSSCDVQLQKKIRLELKRIMMTVDLEEVTSKYLRTKLEDCLNISLTDMKRFIDDEMIVVMRQMESPSKIFDFLYLGSEWNASNLDELLQNGIGSILNVTREIANFYPDTFEYKNVRIYDDDKADLLKHLKDTHKFICRAKSKNSKILVHCKMGISRSASTVIAFVMKELEMSYLDALKFVREKRSCIQPNNSFRSQLETYGGILEASKQRHNSLWRTTSLGNLNSPLNFDIPIDLPAFVSTDSSRKSKKKLRCRSFLEAPKKSVNKFLQMDKNDSIDDSRQINKDSSIFQKGNLKKAASFSQYITPEVRLIPTFDDFDKLTDVNYTKRLKNKPVNLEIETNQNCEDIYDQKNYCIKTNVNLTSCGDNEVSSFNRDELDKSLINICVKNLKLNTQVNISVNNCNALNNVNSLIRSKDESPLEDLSSNVPSNLNIKYEILNSNTQANFCTEYIIPNTDVSIDISNKTPSSSSSTKNNVSTCLQGNKMSVSTTIDSRPSDKSDSIPPRNVDKFLSENEDVITKSVVACAPITSISSTNKKQFYQLNVVLKNNNINPDNCDSDHHLEESSHLKLANVSSNKIDNESYETINAKKVIHRIISSLHSSKQKENVSKSESISDLYFNGKSISNLPSDCDALNPAFKNECIETVDSQPVFSCTPLNNLEEENIKVIKLKKTISDPALNSKNRINYIKKKSISIIECKNCDQNNMDAGSLVNDNKLLESVNLKESITEQVQYVIAKPFPSSYISNAICKAEIVMPEILSKCSSPVRSTSFVELNEINNVKTLREKFSGNLVDSIKDSPLCEKRTLNTSFNHQLTGNKSIYENLNNKNLIANINSSHLLDENHKNESKFSPIDVDSFLNSDNHSDCDGKSLVNSQTGDSDNETNNLLKTWYIHNIPKRRIQNDESIVLSKIKYFDNSPNNAFVNTSPKVDSASSLQGPNFVKGNRDIARCNSSTLPKRPHSLQSDWMCKAASPHFAESSLQMNNSFSNLNRCN